ncbi:MAG: FAD-dependent oxidoreductase [Methylocella sp.]
MSVELAEVTGFDLEGRHVTAVQPGGRLVNLSYDSLIAAEGAGQSYFGHDEYAEWAPGKTLADALDHRARIFGAFDMAELEDDPEIRRSWLTFAVIVGGPTGVEIAGQIAELSRRSLKHNLRRFDSGEVRVLLFDGGPEIQATFGDKLSSKATRELEKIGVEIHLEPDCSLSGYPGCS